MLVMGDSMEDATEEMDDPRWRFGGLGDSRKLIATRAQSVDVGEREMEMSQPEDSRSRWKEVWRRRIGGLMSDKKNKSCTLVWGNSKTSCVV